MARRRPTLDERERNVAEREAAIAEVLPYLHPVLTKLADLVGQYDREHNVALIDTDPTAYLRYRAAVDRANWVLRELTRPPGGAP